MTWNYRVVKKPVDTPTSLGGGQHYIYGIHEAYYNEDGEVWGITQTPIELSAEHINELKINWLMLMEAFSAPILNYNDICADDGPSPDFEIPSEDDENCEEDTSLDEYGIHEELDLEPFDPDGYARDMAEQNEQEEFQHAEEYVGSPPEQIHALIKVLRSDNP